MSNLIDPFSQVLRSYYVLEPVTRDSLAHQSLFVHPFTFAAIHNHLTITLSAIHTPLRFESVAYNWPSSLNTMALLDTTSVTVELRQDHGFVLLVFMLTIFVHYW